MTTLEFDKAYYSFGGEVEASTTPTICRLPDLPRHQLSTIALDEALLLLRSDTLIDAMFTDIYLKEAVLGGCELAIKAVALRPNLRVLYTTGNSITEKMKMLLIEGMQFLRKPYTQNQLQDSIKTTLAP